MKSGTIIRIALTVFVLSFVFSSVSFAQAIKCAFVNSDEIVSQFTEWNKAQEEFDTDYRAWDDQAKQLQTELEDMISEYDRQKLILSEDKKKEREAAIDAKRQALDAFTKQIFGPNGKAEQRQNDLVQPLLQKINAAIEQVATDENIDFVFTSGGLAYAKKEYDITNKVVDLLEQ